MPLPRPSFVSPMSDRRIPGRANAPKLWPALPVIASCTDPSGNPRSPKRAAIAPAMPAPYARSVFAIGPVTESG
jgi:hypothetical protein